MPAKIITLSQKDQDLLRVALNEAIAALESYERKDIAAHVAGVSSRIIDLRERIL